MRKVSPALALVLLLAACDPTDPQPQASSTPTPSASASASAAPASGARSVEEETDDFLFAYAYPAQAGNIAPLARLLDSRADRLRAQLAEQSAQGRADARSNGFPFNKYSSSVTWEVVAETPDYLSLSAELTSYTGGAHGNYGFDSLVWDKQGERVLQVGEFFTSLAALEEVVGEDLCDLLNAERAKRRGPDAAENQAIAGIEPDDPFNQCVPLSDTTLLLGSTNGSKFNRIGVQIGPYVAGPYAEGSWEFTLPVTAEVLATVAPEFRDAFAARN
ncbi:DUF4163 domain-containing protein [Alteraurantiacibacter buctensis]|uniref:DUF4163 domain-containing protein n=1 Tax=Alteraurantiacibacter buctensis TaxID=1503981 RepID=A0A844Z259_9SPHN|nr:DUF4163 domain-containing protein [Alteraurantiacibacter buctensis]MXO72774.1 DUF4163 domain-containing protein [Alteraurantiacibacter buctensis]